MVQLTRHAPVRMERMRKLAASVDPATIPERGEFLGAGLMGGAYRLEVGDQVVIAKQMGHPQSITGQLNTHSEELLRLKSAKQVAVQNALAMAGFPMATAAVLEQAPEWLLMEEVRGLDQDELSQEERNSLDFEGLRRQMEPTVNQTLEELSRANPGHGEIYQSHLDVSYGNAKFVRENGGVLVAGIFDPVV